MSADDTLLDLTPFLGPERAVLLELLQGLSASDWERPTECPEWNVKGIALHILGDDFSLLTRQRDASTDSLTLFAKDHPGLSFRALLDGFNEQWVAASGFFSTDLLVDMLQLVGEWSDTFYGNVGLETMSREPVGFFAEKSASPYWQVIAREYVERFVHQSQIRRAIGAPELEGELVTAAARVIVRALAVWMRNYGPAAGSTLVIDFGTAGSWTWRRESDHWSVIEGAQPEPTARVAIAPERTVAMLSRGVAPEEALDCITIGGDEAVARGALDVAAPLLAQPDA
jgi:uncharacterized protein (TIGR03083 family)